MKDLRWLKGTRRVLFPALLLFLALSPAGKNSCFAQSLTEVGSSSTASKPEVKRDDPESSSAPKTTETQPLSGQPATPSSSRSDFRVERLPIANGAELLTIFGKGKDDEGAISEVPLLSVVRDTLGDANPENDRLRYLWMLTYSRPTLRQRLAAAVPFLYQRVGNKTKASNSPPPALLDIAANSRSAGSRLVWFGVQRLLLDSYGLPLKLASRSYRRNWSDYYTVHVTQALSILSNYERISSRSREAEDTLASLQPISTTTPGAFSFVGANSVLVETTSGPAALASFSIATADTLELRARLILSRKSLGFLVRPENFRSVVEKQAINFNDNIGHNWELLRQRAEAQGLYFEPLKTPDGASTHAVLWISRSDLVATPNRIFESRFLNISNPWKDERLRRWQGYIETRYLDAAQQRVTPGSTGSRPVELIPLAVYGLDNPKIPILLVDFRDTLNPKKREVSGRVVGEIVSDVLSLSPLSLPYSLGRRAFDWITSRRGMDVNQPTRLNSYSRLKLLLSLNPAIKPGLRAEIDRRLERVSPDPLTNSRAAEILLARQQFDALLDFADRPEGLAAKIDRDRRAEMTPLKHGRVARIFFKLGNALTFGRYVHRETATPELMARMEVARRLDYHLRFLREVAATSPRLEVTSNLPEVKRSLQFVRDHASEIRKSGVEVAVKVFPRTDDIETRQLCLDVLSTSGNKSAKNELLRIYRDPKTNAEWRAAVAESLRKAVTDDRKVSPARARALLNQVDGK